MVGHGHVTIALLADPLHILGSENLLRRLTDRIIILTQFCATNLKDRLDPAVLRRFDLKIQFHYLKPKQAEKLFARVSATIQGYTRPRHCSVSIQMRLAKLSTLTPGDFATVVRQARALGKRYDAEQLMAALEEECRVKQHGIKPVAGFVG